MIIAISLTLDTNDPEAITGMKELLAAQAQQYGDVRDIKVAEREPEQLSLFNRRTHHEF